MTEGKFENIPLTVIDKNSGNVVKEDVVLIRIRDIPDLSLIHVTAACQEGVFDTQLSRLKLKRAKTKADLSEEVWLTITSALLNSDISSEARLPAGYEDVVLMGKLISLEQYDPETGELVGDELADDAPEFEISICSKGVLSVTYGTFQLPLRSVEEADVSERKEFDILRWVQLQTAQMQELRKQLSVERARAAEQEQIAKIKEREIRNMDRDYQLILLDLEDRFYQVLNSKRRRIRELEGNDTSDLDLLNVTYRKRNATNLNHVNIEDIALGNASLELERNKPARKPRKRAKAAAEKQEIKEESSDREESMKEEDGSGADESLGEEKHMDEHKEIKKDIGSSSDVSDEEMTEAEPAAIKIESQLQKPQDTSPGGADLSGEDNGEQSDATVYSGSEEDEHETTSQRPQEDESTDYGSEDKDQEEDTDYE